MSRRYRIFCQLVAIWFLSGCINRPTEQGSQLIPLDFSGQPESVHAIGLIKDVQIVSLDCKETVFGEAHKIIKYKDRIYLMDNTHIHSVIVYDTLGCFINLISKRGKGPEEYIQLTDIFIDSISNTFNLVSRIDKKILKYDLDGRHLLSVDKTQKSFTQFSRTRYGYAGYMANFGENPKNAYNLWTMSQDLKLGKSFFGIDESWESTSLGGGSVFSIYQTNTYYTTPMDHNIYLIEKDGISTPYSFDLGSVGWPSKYKKYEQVAKLRKENRYILRFYHFQETSNHLIVHVLYKGQYLLGVYNKQNAQSHIARLSPYTDKYFFSFGQIVGFDENTIYTLVDAPTMKEFWIGKNKYNDFEAQYPEQIKRLRQKFDHVNEDGNSFLVMYSLN